MHCPRCGHRQNSDEIRFCAKCGFELSDVKQLLNSGSGEKKIKRKNEQRRATRQGFVMIIVGLGIAMILGGLREFFTIPKIAIMLPLFVFMIGGMLRMILPAFSDESNSDEENIDSFINDLETSELSGEQFSAKILPEAEYRPPVDFGAKNYDTNELVAPSSVTEDTTRKLKNELQQDL